jgi:hypothetical protein
MKWTAETKTPKARRFVIEKQLLRSLTPGEADMDGYYLFVWEEERCLYDYLQDTLEIAMEQALEEFGVPLDAWKRVE